MRDDSFNILQIDSKMLACFQSSMFYIRLQNKKGSKKIGTLRKATLLNFCIKETAYIRM